MNDIVFSLAGVDYLILFAYLGFVLWLGFAVGKGNNTSEDYFLAGRSLGWWAVGFSLYATNISSSSLIGMAGKGYGAGVAVYNYEWMATVVLVVFVVFFLPFYLRSRVATMPEFLERRFDEPARYYFSALTILLNIFADLAGTLYAGALVVDLIFPSMELWQSALLLAVFSAIYTSAGGLKAVVYTDSIQAVILIIGCSLLAIIGYMKVGSWEAVRDVMPAGHFDTILPASDKTLPWPALPTGVFLLGFYYWCTNQYMVQRTLGARNLDQGRWGALFCGFLKLFGIFLFIVPGCFARVLFPELPRDDDAFPALVFGLLPAGIRGLVVTALLAAIMSSVSSTLNSVSTLITLDFVHKWRRDMGESGMVWVGRLTTIAAMLVAVAWVPVIENSPSLWDYLQKLMSYVCPPIIACFVLGLFWKGAARRSAILTFVAGHAAGGLLFLWKEGVVVPAGTPILGISPDFHWLYVPPLLVLFCMVFMVVASMFLQRSEPESLRDVTFSPSLLREVRAPSDQVAWYLDYRLLACGLLAMTALLVGLWW